MKKKLLIILLIVGGASVSNAQFWDYTDPVKIMGDVNTEGDETIPIFSPDSSLLYFVRTYDEDNKGGAVDQDVWSSKRSESGTYIDCKRVKNVNNKFNNAIVGIGEAGKRLYLFNTYDGKKDLEKGIAVVEGDGKPQKIAIPELDIEGDFYGFHVNRSEDVIIISYNGPNSKGEEDLYVSTKSGTGWSKPLHMGNEINSEGFEISPFLSPTSDTLFFSSNGFGGEGNADIFYSVKQGSWDNWSAPKNLGNKINSAGFDAFFTYSKNQAYWSSNRQGEHNDIYTVNILTPPPLKTTCSSTDATVYKGADGKVSVAIEGGAPPFTYAWSNGGNESEISGLSKGEYTVTVTDVVGQVSVSSCAVNEPPMELDPVVAKGVESMEFLHNFGYNKNKLSVKKGKLKKFVKGIEKQLKEGVEDVTIKIVSSASKVPTSTYGTNENLAKIRAENMKYDLIAYFEKKHAGKVNVVVDEVKVDGPEYADDSGEREKYTPYQFVQLKTE